MAKKKQSEISVILVTFDEEGYKTYNTDAENVEWVDWKKEEEENSFLFRVQGDERPEAARFLDHLGDTRTVVIDSLYHSVLDRTFLAHIAVRKGDEEKANEKIRDTFQQYIDGIRKQLDESQKKVDKLQKSLDRWQSGP